jgi:hypothetical protein
MSMPPWLCAGAFSSFSSLIMHSVVSSMLAML